MKIRYEGNVEAFYGYSAVRWSVYRTVRNDNGDEVCEPEAVARGEAKNMHGAKSIIAKKCRQFEQLEELRTDTFDYTKHDFCGCCGRQCDGKLWCSDCDKHIKQGYGIPMWERAKPNCEFAPSLGGRSYDATPKAETQRERMEREEAAMLVVNERRMTEMRNHAATPYPIYIRAKPLASTPDKEPT